MKKLLLAYCLLATSLSLVCAGPIKYKGKRVPLAKLAGQVERSGGIHRMLKRTQENLELLRLNNKNTQLAVGRDLSRSELKLPKEIDTASFIRDVSALGFHSATNLPLIEQVYQASKGTTLQPVFEGIVARTALRHGEYDFLNEFMQKEEVNSQFWLDIYNEAQAQGQHLIKRPSPTLEQNQAFEQVEGKLSLTQERLTATADRFSPKVTRMWLAEEGEIKQFQGLIKTLDDKFDMHRKITQQTLEQMQHNFAIPASYHEEVPREFLRERDSHLPAAYREAILRLYEERYQEVTQHAIEVLNAQATLLEQYAQHPETIPSPSFIGDFSDFPMAQLLAVKSQLVALVHNYMVRPTNLQKQLYDAFTALQNYYLVMSNHKEGAKEDWNFIERPMASNTIWNYEVYLERKMDDYIHRWRRIQSPKDWPNDPQKLQKEAAEISQTLYVPSLKDKILTPREFHKNLVTWPFPDSIWVGEDSYVGEVDVKGDYAYMNSFHFMAYSAEVLRRSKELIALDAENGGPLLDKDAAYQQLADVVYALIWEKYFFGKGGCMNGYSSPMMAFSEPLRDVASYWGKVLFYYEQKGSGERIKPDIYTYEKHTFKGFNSPKKIVE